MPRYPTRGKGAGFAWLKAHVDYQGDNCLIWPMFRESRVGRGMVNINGVRGWAHRFMCQMAHGDPPTPKHQAAHSCGKGHEGCCNPRHLEWKTNSQNQLDRRKHGTLTKCTWSSYRGKLSQEQIAEIRALKGKKTQMALAEQFGVSLGCIQYWLKYRATRGHDREHRLIPISENGKFTGRYVTQAPEKRS